MQALESLTETQVSSCETKSSTGRGCRGPSRPHPLLPSSRSPSGRGGDAEGGAWGGHWVWGGPTLHPTASSLGGGLWGCDSAKVIQAVWGG